MSASRRLSLIDGITYAVVLLALGVGGMRLAQFIRPPVASTLEVADTSRIADFERFHEGRRFGSVDAPVTIVEFSDFQCPFCARAAPYLWNAIDERTELALVYRHLPGGQLSYQAAVAAECAARQGRFREMHDLLFAERAVIGNDRWSILARDADIPEVQQFTACMESDDARAVVRRDSVAAVALGAYGTPTFLINDLLVVGYHGEAIMDDLIEVASKSHQ